VIGADFAATLSVAGLVLFNIFIAQPALRPPAGAELRAAIGRRLAWTGSIGLLLTLLSGAAWFVCWWRSRSVISHSQAYCPMAAVSSLYSWTPISAAIGYCGFY
jgi:hypothetical protein